MADLIGEQNLSPEAIEKLEIFNTALLKSIKVACNGDRGWASQTILKELRDFVECVMFLIAFQGKESQRKYDYQNIDLQYNLSSRNEGCQKFCHLA